MPASLGLRLAVSVPEQTADPEWSSTAELEDRRPGASRAAASVSDGGGGGVVGSWWVVAGAPRSAAAAARAWRDGRLLRHGDAEEVGLLDDRLGRRGLARWGAGASDGGARWFATPRLSDAGAVVVTASKSKRVQVDSVAAEHGQHHARQAPRCDRQPSRDGRQPRYQGDAERAPRACFRRGSNGSRGEQRRRSVGELRRCRRRRGPQSRRRMRWRLEPVRPRARRRRPTRPARGSAPTSAHAGGAGVSAAAARPPRPRERHRRRHRRGPVPRTAFSPAPIAAANSGCAPVMTGTRRCSDSVVVMIGMRAPPPTDATATSSRGPNSAALQRVLELIDEAGRAVADRVVELVAGDPNLAVGVRAVRPVSEVTADVDSRSLAARHWARNRVSEPIADVLDRSTEPAVGQVGDDAGEQTPDR